MKILDSVNGLLILEAQNGDELSFLNKLIVDGIAINSEVNYQVFVSIKKTKTELESFLKDKGFTVS